jgi:hypothetical protein
MFKYISAKKVHIVSVSIHAFSCFTPTVHLAIQCPTTHIHCTSFIFYGLLVNVWVVRLSSVDLIQGYKECYE